jgi:energy-coupling factor transporter ATP-binding protein EcfA2
VPGASSFRDEWAELAADKDVFLMYDNDHPVERSGRTVEGAGYLGMERAAKVLAKAEQKPKTISYMRWGGTTYWEPTLPSGYDVRDVLTSAESVQEKCRMLSDVLGCVTPMPEEWLGGRSMEAMKNGDVSLECLPCQDYDTLRQQLIRAMKITPGLERTFICMLSAVLGTGSPGSQLWLLVVGPPSCGKSTLAEALAVSRKHVKALSTFKGFHSGWKEGDGKENQSLIIKLRGMTLITKDGDPIVTSPNREQIMGDARDVYDKVSRSDYKNGMGMDHAGVHMTWILCGTSELYKLDRAELGARFLTCVIMDKVDDELETDINRKVIKRVIRNMSARANGDGRTHEDADVVKFMQMTGGYIEHLHANAEELISGIEVSQEAEDALVDMGTFVAYMRARPSLKQEEHVEREASHRLVEQLARLAMCSAAAVNKREVDAEVISLCRHIAMDSARGRTVEICRQLHAAGREGLLTQQVAMLTKETEDSARKLLRFLAKIDAVETYEKESSGVVRLSKVTPWRLTDRVSRLWESVMGK